MSVESLNDHRPMNPIYEFTVYQRHDNSLMPALVWADANWIDSNGKNASDRLRIISGQLEELSRDLLKQAHDLEQTVKED